MLGATGGIAILEAYIPAPAKLNPTYARYVARTADPDVFAIHDPVSGEWVWTKRISAPQGWPETDPEYVDQ